VVIGAIAQNAAGAVELLPNHDPSQIAGINSLGQTPDQIGLSPHIFVQAIGATDHKTQLFDETVIKSFLHPLSQLRRAELLAAFVQSYNDMMRVLLLSGRVQAQTRKKLLPGPFTAWMSFHNYVFNFPGRFQTVIKNVTQLGISGMGGPPDFYQLNLQALGSSK
jgi:hypothetical protein